MIAHLDLSRAVSLASVMFGIAGTALLFFYSYTLQPLDGTVFGSPDVDAANQSTKRRNVRRMLMQRIGFALLCISFIAQGVVVFLPS